MVAIPKDASTIVLMRDINSSGAGPELLMLRRHTKSSFLPGAYVFPGGTVEVADCVNQVEEICHGLTFRQARNIIYDASSPEKALGFFVAAIREAFEEAGVLLAYRECPDLIAISEEQKARFAGYRRQVREDPFSFLAIVQKEGLRLATDRLFYFAHWITPEIMPIRFDTRFFVAAAPPNQEALYDALETTDSKWITPQEVVEEHKKGRLNVAFPTLCNIRALAEFSSVEEVIASTQGKEVPAIQPLKTMMKFG